MSQISADTTTTNTSTTQHLQPRSFFKRHRILAALLVFFIGLCVVIVGEAATNKFGTQFEDLNSYDQQALAELGQLAKTTETEPLWKDFRLTENPLLLMSKESKYSYLVNPTEKVNSPFATQVVLPAELNHLHVWRVSRFNPRLWATKIAGGNFNTIGQYKTIAGNNTYYVKFDADSFEPQYSSEHFIAFLSHESFHFFKQQNWRENSRFVGQLSEEGMRLLDEKMRLLDEIRVTIGTGTTTKDVDRGKLREQARQLVEIENRRKAENKDYVMAEQWMETVEGTAQFMGIRAAQIVGYDFGPMYFDNVKDVPFSDVVPYYQDGKLDEGFLRDRLPYESGGEIALMLRALDDDSSWQAFLSEQTLDKPRTLIDAVHMELGN